MLHSIFLPLAQVNVPGFGELQGIWNRLPAETPVIGLFLGLLLIGLLLRRPRRSAKPPRRKRLLRQRGDYIVIDGSNVMHWKDNAAPTIFPVQAVVAELRKRGFTPGVVFDANAGHKLSGRYMNELDFATLLTLPPDQVFVVPKGTPADPWILQAARDFGARIVTRDRFRDWTSDHPEVAEPGHLVRGGYNTAGEFWLEAAKPAEKVPA